MAAMTDNHDDSIDNAEEIIERFGGIRPMASKMDVPVTTVQGWKKRNVIPANRRAEVIKAAQVNNIDVSDLIAGVANENTAASFSAEMAAVKTSQDSDSEARHEEAVLMAKRRAAAESHNPSQKSAPSRTPTSNEEMLAQMKHAQSLTFTKNMWFTVGFVAFVVVVAAVMLWPTKQQVMQNKQNITRLQNEVTEVKQPGFFKKLIPGDIEERLGKMQQQAQTMQKTVGTLSNKVEQIANDVVLDKNADINTRLQRLEEHAAELGAPSQLLGLLQKVEGLEQSVGGQQQLSSAVAQLNMLVGSMQDQGGDVDAALAQAQQQDDALGQTLQGVDHEDLKAAAMLLALAQFRSSLNRNEPFENDLALMQKMLGDKDPQLNEAITKLAPKAESGVLTPDGLKSRFKGMAGDIVVSSLKGEDVSIQEKAKARFNDVLSVEKNGELLTGTDTQAKVARAQKMLDDGDVQGAIAELQSLDGEAAQTAQPFIDEAQMTMLAQQLQGVFTHKVMSEVGGSVTPVTSGGAQASVKQLLSEIKKFAPQGKLVGDPDSGFMIYQKQDLAPKHMPAP